MRRRYMARVAVGHPGDFFRRAFGDNPAAPCPAFRPQVDHPIGGFYNVQIVFDDEQCVAGVAQFEENVQEFGHIVKMQAGGRFVQNV